MKHLLQIIILLFIYTHSLGQNTNAYKSGEQLEYDMRYGWIHGGYATLEISSSKTHIGELKHARLQAKTTGFTDRLYKVNDIYESYFEPATGFPVKAIRNISEGGYKNYNELIYDNDSNKIYSQKSGQISVPDSTFDILSAIYYLRNMVASSNLYPGKTINIDTYFGDEMFPLILRYKGIETIETDLGEIVCHKFSPVTEVGRVFKTQDDMTIWFSKDINFIPIRVQFELFIGSLKCDLVKYSGLIQPLQLL